ncbi:MAG: S-adenosylmethionine:tRNA ribosyltransferase-isomerase, partial [candidate division Zixibacteria bacterium]|nr:S-adenosylmethionine:tRNA ribosyltransferase-isomerase [candidate division Zixibacteria bacterium]
MNLSDFDFSVPTELIAKHPLKNRDGCRLLVVRRTTEATCGERSRTTFEHRQFSDLLEYLHPGDVLVLNDAKVNKSRFFATRPTSPRGFRTGGGKVEVLLTRPVQDFVGAGSPRPGEETSPLQKNDLGLSSLSLRRRGTEGEVVGAGLVPARGAETGTNVWEAILSHSARVKEGEFLTLENPNGNSVWENGDSPTSLSLRRRGTEGEVVGAGLFIPSEVEGKPAHSPLHSMERGQRGEVSFPPPRVGEGLGERSGFRILSKQNNLALVQIESEIDIFEK